jgi:hypothetical protein
MNRILPLLLALCLPAALIGHGCSGNQKQEPASQISEQTGPESEQAKQKPEHPKAEDQEKALAEIQKLGGHVTVDEDAPGKPVIEVNLAQTPVTDAGLTLLKALPRLQVLDLSQTQVTDAGLASLKGLDQLQSLYLLRTNIADAGLQQLASLPNLRDLNISQTQVTDAGLQYLKGLHQLRILYVRQTTVTDAGAQELQKALPNCNISWGAPASNRRRGA